MHKLSEPTFSTVWFRGHPYPISAYPGSTSPAGSSWYVLHSDGHWYRVRERRDVDVGEEGRRAVEADVIAWLEEHHASPERESLPPTAARYMMPAPHAHAKTVRSLAFEDGCQAADFVRRLGVLFDGRTTRLIMPSMPMIIYGPALLPANEPVILYAGRGALALAKYLGITLPAPGDEVETTTIEDKALSVIFGPMARAPEPWGRV